ncbi:squalene/phytoene synthase family protein [Sphingomonas sp. 8AM]|uniref:squalene/phytoene synthase family protein n=1 Tax=Sphingomonas sp. 8AM TaxID=2653170 RepID=UPI0013586BF4|nr:squalene/phytoene synthase family protein [Sphingomonas sp. 8AM]
MVNQPFIGSGTDPERTLAMTYAAPEQRPALAALWGLDDRLADILRTTREPMVGQMRLTWWHTALSALDEAPPPAEPVLQALARDVVPRVNGARLATLVEGWEALLEPALNRDAMLAYATHRGGGLFAAIGTIVGVDDPAVATSGEGWALVDLARHIEAPDKAALARAMAQELLEITRAFRWPAAARAIGAMAQTARLDLAARPRPHGHPARAARLLWHRVTGR